MKDSLGGTDHQPGRAGSLSVQRLPGDATP